MDKAALQVESSFVDAWAAFARDPRFQCVREVDHTYTSCGIDEAFLNNILATRGEPPLGISRLRQIVEPFTAKKIGVLWRLGPCTKNREKVAQLLLDFGLMPVGDAPGMLLENLAPLVIDPVLKIEKVKTSADLQEWFTVWQGGFGMSPGATQFCLSLFNDQGFAQDPNFGFFVGRVNEQAVCCASTYHDGKMAGLFNVTTLDDFRKRGFGSAISHFATEQAREEWNKKIYLFASAQGFTVYKRLGFKTVLDLQQFYLAPA